MKTTAAVILFSVAILGGAGDRDRDVLVRFSGGVGVIPVSGPANPQNPDGTFQNVVQNVVRGVPPSGQLWRIGDLHAEVFTGGRIRVRGRGLLLAGGARVGESLGLSVIATLICENASPAPLHSTTAQVLLDADGDFRIDDRLDSVPAACASPVLLIRSSAGPWLAAGFPQVAGDWK